jgi:biotin operon repressor
MSQGWVLSWRKIKDWEWYKIPNMAHFFQHIIREANHEPKQWQGTTIERGQLVCGRIKLAQDTGLSERQIRTCIKHLKSTSEVSVKTTNKYSIITICNYNDYQNLNNKYVQQNDQPPVTQATSKRPANDQQATTTNNDNNDNNDKQPTKRERASPFNPPSFSEVSEYSKSISFQLDAQQFIDFYTAKGWMIGKNRMKDWRAAVRTWQKREPPKSETIEEQMARLEKAGKI